MKTKILSRVNWYISLDGRQEAGDGYSKEYNSIFTKMMKYEITRLAAYKS